MSKNASYQYQQRINRVINYINADLSKTPDFEQLASLAHFSKFHFHRIFKAINGVSVAEFVKRQRLEKAAALLIYNPKMSITEIALALGFSSSANFSKAFKQHFDCSASHYRQHHTRQISKIGKASSACITHTAVSDFNIEVKQMSIMQLAYFRNRGKYQHAQISRQYQQLQHHHYSAPNTQALLGITWTDSHISEEKNWYHDACIVLANGQTAVPPALQQTFNPGHVASWRIEINVQEFDTGLEHYWQQFLAIWLPQSGYQPADRPSFEVYGQRQQQRQQIQLCLPVKPLEQLS